MTMHRISILETQSQYIVQDVPNFPKKYSFLIGKKVLLTEIGNQQVSVQRIGIKHWIPTKSIIKFDGYVFKGVNASKAEAFAVVQPNPLYPIGTIFTDILNVTNTDFSTKINDRVTKVPLGIVLHMVKVKTKTDIVKNSKSNNVLNSAVTLTEELIAPEVNRKNIEEIPEVLSRLLPNVNIKALKEDLMQVSEGCWDYEGNVHDCWADVDKANARIRHKTLTNHLIKLINNDFNDQCESIRNQS